MNYKKIILIVFLSIFLFSCDDTFKEIGRKFSIKKVKNEEMEKYNGYIEIHNNLTNIENEISFFPSSSLEFSEEVWCFFSLFQPQEIYKDT